MTRAVSGPKGRRAAPKHASGRSERAPTPPSTTASAGKREPAIEIVPLYQPNLRREVTALLLLLARAQVGDRALAASAARWRSDDPTSRRGGEEHGV